MSLPTSWNESPMSAGVGRPRPPAAVENALAVASQQAQQRRFWSIVQKKVQAEIARALPHPTIEVDSIQFPLFIPTILPGLTTSVVVGFPCRVIAYTFVSVAGGTITVDLRRSRPVTHPVMDSLPGAGLFPTFTGVYQSSDDTIPSPVSLWANTDLARGDILHCYVTASVGTWTDGTFAVHVRRIA